MKAQFSYCCNLLDNAISRRIALYANFHYFIVRSDCLVHQSAKIMFLVDIFILVIFA